MDIQSIEDKERMKYYLNVLNILSYSTDEYLYLWDMDRDENYFFGDIDREYAVRKDGEEKNRTAEMLEITYPADREMLKADLEKLSRGEKLVHDMNYRWVNRKGEAIWINCRGTVIQDDTGRPFVMIGRVSDKRLRQFYHPLTRLFNKEKLMADMRERLLGRNRGYFMLLGIDNLDGMNLQYGKNKGNTVIKQCADILEKQVQGQNIWHVENERFMIYLDAGTESEVVERYHSFSDALASVCTISAGVVPNKAMFGDENNMYACAALTFEKARSDGMQTLQFFSQEEMLQRIQEIRFLEELQESVKNGCKGFYLCYQPQIKTGNYHLYGAEALLRYHSEEQGEIYPDQFIPLLENSKLIHEVGLWVLETALLQCMEWRKLKKDFHISVNFSAVQLEDKGIAEKVLEILKKTGMPGTALTIELTESVQLTGIRNFSYIFNAWREAGIELSIDDFGTGYASMSYLKELDVSEIKIDRLFVQGVEEATYNYRLISNMIEFARSNDIRICCEGVEDLHELTVLEGLSPNLIQGYLFAKPCKKEEFENSFIDKETDAHREYEKFVRKIYEYKGRMHTIYFNSKDILRENNVGLWIIRMNEEERYYEMHADETMERVLCVDKKYMPEECYEFWYDRIREDYRDYVRKNVKRMMDSDKVVQLQYPWLHPKYGEVTVRCSGRCIGDTDGMVTLEGYHRILDNIEETNI